MIIDSHIHLCDKAYDSIINFLMNYMQKLHVCACCMSIDYCTSQKTIMMAENYDFLFPFIGIHPNEIYDDIESFLNFSYMNKDKISGFGEIGLDASKKLSDIELKKQKIYFTKQLTVAEKLKKPISVHSRNTLDIIFDVLSSYSIQNVSLHWFDGTKKQLIRAIDLGFFISYSPLLLYSKDKQILLACTDKNNILFETDGPVRFSNCFHYQPAQICYIPSIILHASKLLKKPYDELSTIIENNTKKFLDYKYKNTIYT